MIRSRFQCRPLASAGKVSAAVVTDRKRDNFGSTVTDFKGYTASLLPQGKSGATVRQDAVTRDRRYGPLTAKRSEGRKEGRFSLEFCNGVETKKQNDAIPECQKV